jgi:hypothetical protein
MDRAIGKILPQAIGRVFCLFATRLLVAGSAVFRSTPHPVPLYSAECVESKSWEIRAPEMSFAHSHSGIFMRHYYM